jgi:hypothetical protein
MAKDIPCDGVCETCSYEEKCVDLLVEEEVLFIPDEDNTEDLGSFSDDERTGG